MAERKQAAKDAGGKAANYCMILVRWVMGDSLSDAELEVVHIPSNSSAKHLTDLLEQESPFIRRYCLEHKIENGWSWDHFDVTSSEIGHATMLPSFRFCRPENVIDILPRPRIPVRCSDELGRTQWLFESTTQRLRREFTEQQTQTQNQNQPQPPQPALNE